MIPKLFVKNKIVPEYIIEDIKYDLKGIASMSSEIGSGKKHGSVKREIRSSLSKKIKRDGYVDLCRILEEFCSSIHPKHTPSGLILKEIEHLQYGISDHFKAHTDTLPNLDPKRTRRFTTITLLSKAEDLEGGDLFIYDENKNKININLEVGETVIFYSTALHEVSPITKGGREVLVGWIYDR